MDATQARASLSVLLAVAKADGELDREKKRVLDVVARHEYEDDEPPESRFVSGADALDRALAVIRAPELRELTWKAALALASLDGETTAVEHALLVRIHAALVPDSPPADVVVAEKKYRGRLEQAEEEIAEATADFLHRVSDSVRGKPSQKEYEALVSELDAKKRRIYSSTLSILPPG